MSQEHALFLVQSGLLLALKLAAPMLIASVSIGTLVSIFQAATQIQEQTLVFVPKVLAMLGVLMACGGWMMATVIDYSHQIILSISTVAR